MIRLCRLSTNSWLSVEFLHVGFSNDISLSGYPKGLIDGILHGIQWKYGTEWIPISMTDKSGYSHIFDNSHLMQ